MHRPTMPLAALVLVVLGSLDKVLGLIRARPLGEYSGVLTGIFNSLAYFIIYCSVLAVRVKMGAVDWDHLRYIYFGLKRAGGSSSDRDQSSGSIMERTGRRPDSAHNSHASLNFSARSVDHSPGEGASDASLPYASAADPVILDLPRGSKSCTARCQDLGAWKYIAIAGFGDALGGVLSFVAQPYLPGITVTLLEQLGSPVIAGWSMLLLKVRYSVQEVAGVCLLLVGVLLTLFADDQRSPDTPLSSNNKEFYAIIFLLSCFPVTLSFVLKEKVFRDFALKSIMSTEREEVSMAYLRALDRDFQLPGAGGAMPSSLLSSVRQSSDPGVTSSGIQTYGGRDRGDSVPGVLSSVHNQRSRSNSLLFSTNSVGSQGRTGRVSRGGQDVLIGTPAKLDMWCVISTAALFQILWSPFIVIVTAMTTARHEDRDTWEFLSSALTCLSGQQPVWDQSSTAAGGALNGAACDGSIGKYVAYMVSNVAFNISLFVVMQRYSALLCFVSMKLTAPLAAVLFWLPLWRWAGLDPVEPTWIELASFCVMLVGLIIFRWGTEVRERHPGPPTPCCWPIVRAS